jgi:hypothetical protein
MMLSIWYRVDRGTSKNKEFEPLDYEKQLFVWLHRNSFNVLSTASDAERSLVERKRRRTETPRQNNRQNGTNTLYIIRRQSVCRLGVSGLD